MCDEDLVQIVERNTERVDPLQRSVAHIEDELIAVSQLDQEAGGSLLEPRHRHTGAKGDDAHLVGLQLFRAGVVDVMRRVRLRGRPRPDLPAGRGLLRTRDGTR
jgi:hypothetical protein